MFSSVIGASRSSTSPVVHQPMWNEDGNVGVIFNGEIYNHVELRRELERKGHVFRSDHSDTEVLVHGYEEWGEALPERLNGMFAFAILRSHPGGGLFLARDRFGEKPLYYAQMPGLFAFASELSALCRAPGRRACDVDLQSLAEALRLWLYSRPAHALCGIREATRRPSPSHSISPADAKFASRLLALPARIRTARFPIVDEPALVEELTPSSIRSGPAPTISDVPLGVFLSGGIDSSSRAVADGRAMFLDRPRSSTFTIGFTEPSFDESGSSLAGLADAFGTDHQEKQLDLERRPRPDPSKCSDGLDEPLGDASILPTYLLSSFTRQFVTVALSRRWRRRAFRGLRSVQGADVPRGLYARLVPSGLHQRPRTPRRLFADFHAQHELRIQA